MNINVDFTEVKKFLLRLNHIKLYTKITSKHTLMNDFVHSVIINN